MHKRISLYTGLGIGLVLGGLLAWVNTSAGQDESKGEPPCHPYLLLSGQVSEGFEVFYALDQDTGRLGVFKVVGGSEPDIVAVGGRDLAKDFERRSRGAYTMARAQLTSGQGVLVVADNASKRVMAYKIDANRKTIVPIKGADLRKVFESR